MGDPSVSRSSKPSLVEVAEASLSKDYVFLRAALEISTKPEVLSGVVRALFQGGIKIGYTELVELTQRTPGAEVAVEIASTYGTTSEELVGVLLENPDPMVVEAACFAAGEGTATAHRQTLEDIAVHHEDPLCRESAIAALGAIGDPASLGVILAALGDRPYIRRRAIVAMAAFDDPRVEAALLAATKDRDSQVKALAEDLLKFGDRDLG